MRPERFKDSGKAQGRSSNALLLPSCVLLADADVNLGVAIGALSLVEPGVYIAMSGRVYPHDKVKVPFQSCFLSHLLTHCLPYKVARDTKGRFVSITHPEAQAGDDPGIRV